MAEGWGRHLWPRGFSFYSAGLSRHGLNPKAVRVMKEAGVDISGHRSKTLADLSDVHFDLVFTVCGHADETCPVFSGATRKIHRGFDDPPQLEKSARTEAEALAHYRRICLEIKDFILDLEIYLA